jgi:hypothetical protein
MDVEQQDKQEPRRVHTASQKERITPFSTAAGTASGCAASTLAAHGETTYIKEHTGKNDARWIAVDAHMQTLASERKQDPSRTEEVQRRAAEQQTTHAQHKHRCATPRIEERWVLIIHLVHSGGAQGGLGLARQATVRRQRPLRLRFVGSFSGLCAHTRKTAEVVSVRSMWR